MVLELDRAGILHCTVNVLNTAELYTFQGWIKQKRSGVDQPGMSVCLSQSSKAASRDPPPPPTHPPPAHVSHRAVTRGLQRWSHHDLCPSLPFPLVGEGQGLSLTWNPTFLWKCPSESGQTVALGNNDFCTRCESIYDCSCTLCLLCQRAVCICADHKNSVSNKNKHFIVELGFKDPIKVGRDLF